MVSTIPAFLGNFNVSVDSKQRVAIPASLRETLQRRYADEADRVIVSLAPNDTSIGVYPVSVFNGLMEKLQEQTELDADSQSLMILFSASARECVIDRQGRIRLPDDLIEHAGLSKEAVFCGQFNRMQIWNPERWNVFVEETKSTMSDRSRNVVGAMRRS